MAPGPETCHALPCAEAVGFWLAGLGHEADDCGTGGWGDPGASAGLLVGEVRVQKTLVLLLAHCWVKPGPGVSAGLLAGRARFWNLVAEPGIPELVSVCWGGGGRRGVQFLTQLNTESRVF